MSQANCERCGAPLPPEARFCPSCGSPVGARQAEERKVVTALFADIAGSTELTAGLDPERSREVMAAFFREVTEELESLRGRAESFTGDAVLGVFGIPYAHDDDAVRAVRAALSIRDRIEHLREELGLSVPLRVRIGINTGPVAVGAGMVDRFHLAGAEVHLAARLQQAAQPGEVLVGETTRQLTMDAVEFGPMREIAAKGFEEEVHAWPILALSTRSSRRTIPLVDRRRELALLTDAFERAQETSRAHMVSLLGEPGIGKSRVAQEFLASLPERAKVLAGRASAFEEDVTLAPIAEMVRRELGVEREAPDAEVRRRLEEVVAGCCDPSDVDQVTARLGVALGLGAESRDEHKYRVAEVRAGLIAYLTGLTREGRPSVLVFEDLHLAQPPLLELVEQVAREARRVPILLLCVARWDLLDLRPDWAGGLRDALTLYLEPLSLDDATQLALRAGERLDAETAERIARQAGGNPFFIVETTGMLLHERGEAPASGAALPGLLLPPTVQAVVGSRIDHLPELARDLVRKASVFPRSRFTVSDLAVIADPREETLKLLEDEELLVQDEDRPDMWRFRHSMLRDVAYESLAKRERQRLHLLVADKLAGPETADRYPRAIAYHREQAARAALDLEPKDRTLADRAVEALAKAGDLALYGIESRAAADLYERALTLAGPERGWGVREARILAGLGEARYWLGEFDEAMAPLSRALEVGGEDIQVRADASRFLADITLSIKGDAERAGALFDDALTAARELGDPWTLARALLSAGWLPYWRDDLGAARAMFEEALAIARSNPERDAWAEARALVSLAVVVSPVGDERECEELVREALAIGERTGDAFTVAVAKGGLASSLRRMWRLDEALPHSDDAIRTFRELGARWELADALIRRGSLHRLGGRLPEAEADLREALRLCREHKERSLVTWAGSQLTLCLVAAGDAEGARRALEEAAALAGGEEPRADDDLRQAEALLLLAEGDRDGAAELARLDVETGRRRGLENQLASSVWWTGSLFGPEAVGGGEEMQRAKKTLEAHHWFQVLQEPGLVLPPGG
ncbi:MAG: AAA family ATPase [Actinobacteria bacterium]|nr:AAA family ATPase [Actinomycetota bacterium]